MVRLTNVHFGVMKTFGLQTKGKIYNHRKPIRYQRFQDGLDVEEIIAHYSRDDINSINPRAGQRTFRDAQLSIGRKNYLLPNLSDEDLELNYLFQKELDRQRAIIARINKIRVIIDSTPGKDTELTLEQNISTPFDCANHIHNMLTTRSVVAEILPIDSDTSLSSDIDRIEQHNDSINQDTEKNQLVTTTKQATTRPVYWDMHRPLEKDCRLKFRHFSEPDVAEVNKIYWRSCSFVLGMAVRLAFKDEIKVLLHSWPKPNIKSGSFVYDLALNLDKSWEPGEKELRAFTKIMWNIKGAGLPFDRLQVDREMARKLFATNMFKLNQIDSILADNSNGGRVTVYRCGGLLDMSVGPMISNTSQIGRISLASVHPYETQSDDFRGIFYRFQGVSVPQQLPLSSYLYQNILLNQARKLNKASL